jgi:AmmeMemoRadiSam system protein B
LSHINTKSLSACFHDSAGAILIVMIRIREAAVAGSFYPAGPGELRATVDRLLDSVPDTVGAAPKAPRALIVPHAGYVYSGPVAATAYARLRPHREFYRRVLLLGPAHHVAFDGLALSTASAFRTPLGDVPLDSAAAAALEHPAVRVFDAAHRPEHSLEVQLPFLQCVLGPFTLLPLLVGHAPANAVAGVIDLLWDGPETLVVVSTDLSHYLDYEAACSRDLDTCRAVESLDGGRIGHTEACGAAPLRGLLIAARRRGLRAVTLDLRNSGDTAGGRGRVVGYGAWMFAEEQPCEKAA